MFEFSQNTVPPPPPQLGMPPSYQNVAFFTSLILEDIPHHPPRLPSRQLVGQQLGAGDPSMGNDAPRMPCSTEACTALAPV